MTFKEYPQRQKAASFNLDEVMEKLKEDADRSKALDFAAGGPKGPPAIAASSQRGPTRSKRSWIHVAASATRPRITMKPRKHNLLAAASSCAMAFISTLSYAADPDGKKTFTILHTNDMHSNFIGLGPAADYTPFTLNDDETRGGYARLAAVIAQRKAARKDQGPVLVLYAGDYSMGTAFGAATRETGGELQLMSLMGFDATTFGNHEFDLGPDGLGKSITVAAKAGRVPAVVASNTNFSKDDATLADLQRWPRTG